VVGKEEDGAMPGRSKMIDLRGEDRVTVVTRYGRIEIWAQADLDRVEIFPDEQGGNVVEDFSGKEQGKGKQLTRPVRLAMKEFKG
jgi:hypothetical protein